MSGVEHSAADEPFVHSVKCVFVFLRHHIISGWFYQIFCCMVNKVIFSRQMDLLRAHYQSLTAVLRHEIRVDSVCVISILLLNQLITFLYLVNMFIVTNAHSRVIITISYRWSCIAIKVNVYYFMIDFLSLLVSQEIPCLNCVYQLSFTGSQPASVQERTV